MGHNDGAHTEDAVGVLVIIESGRGHAEDVADVIVDAAVAQGVTARSGTIEEVGPDEVVAADAVVAGCWTAGRVPFGDQPTQRMTAWIDQLPALDGKPVAVFCTYRFFPHTFADVATRTGEIENELVTRFEMRGAKVVARKSIHAKSTDADARILVDRLLEHVHRA
jgi:flavodoxin